ncbi:MAG TPA: zf-HC2 domain-containing protein [Thermoanaerobaculia bacterium]|nr:zf-HC2 domain-containing protein [Thermoanaerobaculia bacterium]
MSTAEHEHYEQALDLELDGLLADDERRALHQHLAACAPCRAERRRLEGLHAALATARVPVRPDFHAAVMAHLPVAPWEQAAARVGAALPAAVPAPVAAETSDASSGRGAWWRAVAALGILAGLTTVLFLLGGAPDAPLAGTVSAVGALAAAAVLAGTGLLGASWSGVGVVLSDLFSRSPAVAVVLAAAVAGLALLALGLLRRPQRAVARQRRE